MTRKSMGILTFGLALVVFLAGCVAPVPGPAPAAPVVAGEAAATAGPAGEPIRIAIILPSSIIDMAWSQSMYDALKAVQAQMGGEAALRVWESRAGLPGRACWLVLRRDLDGSEAKYYLSNAPADTPLLRLAQVGAMRWPIETEFQTEKGETGLDEYEVRTWLGWQHHITMALLAGAFLLSLQLDWGEKPAPDHPPADHAGAATTAAAEKLDA
jgi:hypothetical protein